MLSQQLQMFHWEINMDMFLMMLYFKVRGA
jgi:hypothetical protein